MIINNQTSRLLLTNQIFEFKIYWSNYLTYVIITFILLINHNLFRLTWQALIIIVQLCCYPLRWNWYLAFFFFNVWLFFRSLGNAAMTFRNACRGCYDNCVYLLFSGKMTSLIDLTSWLVSVRKLNLFLTNLRTLIGRVWKRWSIWLV